MSGSFCPGHVGQAFKFRDPLHQPFLHLGRIAQVFSTLARELDDGLHKRRFGSTEMFVFAVEGLHNFAGQLPGLRSAQQDDVTFDTEPEPVVGHDAAGVGVVRGDFGFQGVLTEQALGKNPVCGVLRRDPLQGRELGPDPAGQFPGRLARERHAQDFFRPDPAVGNEPHHTVRHGGGLAGSGTGNDQPRSERGGNDGGLLCGGAVTFAQHGSQFFRGKPGGRDLGGVVIR